MKDESPVEFTRTVLGTATPASARGGSGSSNPSLPNEAVEGRFLPGTLLNGRYRIIALLGRGGMGEVYRATDLTLGQSVALKFLPALASNDPRWLERFHSEVRIARQVSHPNVCRVYDIGEAEGLPYISMEYVDGEDLSCLLRRIGRLPNDKALEISRKVCAGLAAAHARGVIHRDLKPQNIMIDRRGEALICDFGLAGVATEITSQQAREGTPAYMAPEQLKGTEVSLRSDIYSLGLVLYELFTGKKAYSAASVNELLNQQEAMSLTRMTSIANDVDPAVEEIIRKCLDPLPANRPSSALAVSAALPGGDPLAAALAAGQTPTPEMVAASRSEGLRMRYSVPLLLGVLVFLCAFPWTKGRVETLDYTPTDLPPDAIAAKARETIAEMGFPGKAADSKTFLETRVVYLDWLKTRPGSKDWKALFAAESPLHFHYRQSPNLLPEGPDGVVQWNRPAFDVPGMVKLTLNSQGSLRGFEALPYRPENIEQVDFDERKLFERMGFDRSKFVDTAPLRSPGTAFDDRKTLRGPHPKLENTDVTVQYGTWKGRLTSLYLQWPFSPPFTVEPVAKPVSAMARVREVLMTAGMMAFFFYSIILARRNWILGRADRKGALRIAVARLILIGLVWIFSAHFVPSGRMINFLAFSISDAIFSALVLWQLYLALEPALRSRWPRTIVTWNRVLGGNFLDAQVGSHILMGVALGVLITAAFVGRDWLAFSRTGFLSYSGAGDLGGTRSWLAVIFNQANVSLQTGLVVFFTIFGLRVLFRKELPAILATALLLSLTNGDMLTAANPILDFSLYFAVCVGVVFALVRFGTLTTTVAVFVTNNLGQVAMSTDLTTWYMPHSIATLLVLAGIAGFGFWRSMGSQQFVGDN